MHPTPNNDITVVDGKGHLLAFSFADFLEIQLNFGKNLDGNLTIVIVSM